jgi:hypothetical protein
MFKNNEVTLTLSNIQQQTCHKAYQKGMGKYESKHTHVKNQLLT